MSPRYFALHRGPRGVDGYLMYRLAPRWSDLLPDYALRIEEMLAVPGDAERTLWRYCLDHDLVRHVHAWRRPVDEPLLHLLADPRQLRSRTADDVWVRVLDVPRALRSRRYAVAGSIVLEVSDPLCPQVAGRWRLEVGPEGAECRRTDATPDIALDAAALGSLLCGGVSAHALARAGLVEVRAPGAAVRAARIFGWHRAPWNLGEF
jgi:predicted acetyltransferase